MSGWSRKAVLLRLRARLDRFAPGIVDKELTQGAAGTLALRIAFAGLEFLSALALARVFRASGYGTYAFVASWVGVLGIPAALGFDRLLIREVAMRKARGEWELLRGVLRRSSQVVLLASILLAVVVAGCASLIAADSEPSMTVALQIGMIVVPLAAFARVRQAALLGLGRVVFGQTPEMLVQPLLLLCLIGAAYFTGGLAHSETSTVILYAISMLVACLLGIWILRRSLPEQARTAKPEYQTRRWISSAMPFMWLLGMNAIMTNVDTIMVGMLQGAAAAGTYRVASQIAMFVVFPLTCVNMVSAPAIATLYARGELGTLRDRAFSAGRAVLIAAAPIALLLAAFGRPLLNLFGPEFVAGYPALLILSGGYLLVTATGIAGYALIMTKYEISVAVVSALGAGLNVVGNLVLIPLWGINGAACATALSTVAVSLTFAVLAHRALGMRSHLLPRHRLDSSERPAETLQ